MSKKFQTVGSLLRPRKLLQFKEKIERRDDVSYPFYDDFEGYEETEVEATREVIQKQIDHSISVLTDGEFSRSLWHTDFVWGLEGTERYIADHGYFFVDKDGESSYETRKDIGVRIVGKLGGKNHHFIKIAKRLSELTADHETKFCVPSPSHIFGELSWSDNVGQENSFYKTTDELKADLTRAYKEFVTEYAEAGGKILQFDDCLWELFAEDNTNSPFTGQSIDFEGVKALAAEFISINNTVIDHGHSLGLKMWTHNCRGNYSSRNMGGGSYSKIAELFLKQLKYDRFFLEWDDDRAGSLEALSVFKDRQDTEIVLGLLSSKTAGLDDEGRVLSLLEEASQIIDKDRLLLSHQCGFASCDNGNELTEEQQWAKIDQGQRLAAKVWKDS